MWALGTDSWCPVTGRTVRFVSVQRDLTERLQGEEQLALLREQLTHASRLATLGEMAAGLVHELNQPLTSVQLYAANGNELLSAGDLQQLRECLTFIHNQSHRASEIIRRMRAFAGRGLRRREPAKINDLLNEVLGLVETELRQGQVRVKLNLSDNLPFIVVDRIQIQQVLVNLIRNACEAMHLSNTDDPQLEISTRIDAETVRVSVADTGLGVDSTIVATLFEPFQSTKPTGLGLGLTAARSSRLMAGPSELSRIGLAALASTSCFPFKPVRMFRRIEAPVFPATRALWGVPKPRALAESSRKASSFTHLKKEISP